ncbi:MAG: hypothetical protein AABM33_05925 [Pseudomonadota bacterium]
MADRSISFDLRVGESLAIDGGKVLVTLLEKSGQRARLAFIVAEGIDFVKGKKAKAGAEQAKRGLTG